MEAELSIDRYSKLERIDSSNCLRGELRIIESDETKGIKISVINKANGHEEEVSYSPYGEELLKFLLKESKE